MTDDTALKERIGQNIRLARKAAGFSQVTLAGLLGVEQQVISRWELGKVRPTRRETQLAEVLGVDVAYFYGSHDE